MSTPDSGSAHHVAKKLSGAEYLKLCARQKRGEILIYQVETKPDGYNVSYKDLIEAHAQNPKCYEQQSFRKI